MMQTLRGKSGKLVAISNVASQVFSVPERQILPFSERTGKVLPFVDKQRKVVYSSHLPSYYQGPECFSAGESNPSLPL